ncbi:MAG: OmpA family protein [Flavobacteriales bacterium]|nr:OmpA family protein [Flavobacteriales bacterium]MCB9447626.1 OmpA family protein [Flavobacteriales bacterium]
MVRKNIYLWALVLSASLQGSAVAQDCPVPGKKSQALFDDALSRWRYDRKNAMSELQELADKEEDFTDLQLFLGGEFYKDHQEKIAYKYFQKAVQSCPDRDPYAYLYMAEIAYNLQYYDKSIMLLEKFFGYPQSIKSAKDKADAEKLLRMANFYDKVYKNPVPFDPHVVDGISTEVDEYLAMVSPDDEYFFFTRGYSRKDKNLPADYVFEREISGDDRIEKFCRSNREDGKWQIGEPLPPPFNTNMNEGGPTVSLDNKELYFTVCTDIGTSLKNCDIYYAQWRNSHWSDIRSLGDDINDPQLWDSQPSISSDGQTLYFASMRPGGLGGSDIYVCHRLPGSQWSKPENLGAPINTPGNEKSPFIHTDSQTLYFSSDGHPGLGGYDIFYTRADKKTGKWMEPTNIGYPINKETDELGFFVSTDGQTAYFASNTLKGGVGGYDIYSFPLYKEAQPEKVLLVKGEVKDENGEVAKDAKLELKSLKTKEVTEIKINKDDGKYVAAVTVQADEDFILSVKEKDKAFNAVYLETKKPEPVKPMTVAFETKEIKVGESYQLNDIIYATNSFDLSAEAMAMIDEFIDYLTRNPTLKIAIQGHTDNQGDAHQNMELSNNRARSVYQYLVIEGIDPDRLSYKGFGQTNPIASNTSEEGRARNRRTEFKIIGK